MEFIDVFSFIPQVVQKQTLGKVETKTFI